MAAPTDLGWVPAVTAVSTAVMANYTFVNNGGAGDTITDTLGTAAALTALNLAFDTHVVVVGDRLLVRSQTTTTAYQNGIYVATTVLSGQVATLTLATPGTGYNNGTFRGVSTTSNGAGTGVLVDITIVGGIVTSVALSNVYSDTPSLASGPAVGSGYVVGNTIVPSAAVIGAGSGTLSITVATLAPAYVLTRAQNANTSQQFPGVTAFVSTGATLAGHAFVQTNSPVTLDGFGIATVGSLVQPTGLLTNATYTGVALLGGSGTGALATIVVSGGVAGTPTITTAGVGYRVGDVLTFSGFGFGQNGTVTVATLTNPPASSAVTFVDLLAI